MNGIYEDNELTHIGHVEVGTKKVKVKQYETTCPSCNIAYKLLLSNIKKRQTKFCRKCYQYELKHIDGVGTRLYTTWNAMLQRCSNPKNNRYEYYGGKGITVCEDWETWSNFRDWANINGYTDELTIERRDSNKNYHPHNCEWITKSENTIRSNDRDNMNNKYIKIRSSDIPDIIEAKSRGISNRELTKKYNCSYSAVARIK